MFIICLEPSEHVNAIVEFLHDIKPFFTCCNSKANQTFLMLRKDVNANYDVFFDDILLHTTTSRKLKVNNFAG